MADTKNFGLKGVGNDIQLGKAGSRLNLSGSAIQARNAADGAFVNFKVLTPVADEDAATKLYVDTTAQGLDAKESCAAATTANLANFTTTSGGQFTSVPATIDGVTLAEGDRVLVKDQSTQTQNGIYVVTATTTTLIRASDHNSDAEINAGNYVFVTEGTTYANTGWVLQGPDPLTMNSSNLVWVQFSGSGTYTAGTGLTLTGTTFDLDFSELTSASTIATADELIFQDGAVESRITVANFLADRDIVTATADGVLVRTANDTYASRTLTASAVAGDEGISIVDGDGVSGNPTIGIDIVGQTNLATDSVDDADELLIYHSVAGGTEGVGNYAVTAAKLKTYMNAGTSSTSITEGDSTLSIADAGTGILTANFDGTDYWTSQASGTSFEHKVDFTVDSATTNADIPVLRITATSTGTPAAGIGPSIEFESETSAGAPGNLEVGGLIALAASDVTATSEDFDFAFQLMAGGAAATEAMRITSTGALATVDAFSGTFQSNGEAWISATANAETELYHNNVGKVRTSSIGLDFASSSPTLRFYTDDTYTTSKGNIQFGTGITIANQTNGGDVVLSSNNTGAASRDLFRGDPDAGVSLYYPGDGFVIAMTTASPGAGGLTVDNDLTSGTAGLERVLTEADLEAGAPRLRYAFSTTTTAADPGAGILRFDNATPGSVTNLYIDDVSDNALDASRILSNLADGDILTIGDQTDPADYIVCSVNGTPTDNTGWWTVPVTIIHSGTLPADTNILNIDVQWFSQSGVGDIGGTITNDQVAFGAATANTIEGSANLTFDGTILSLTGNQDITGDLDVDNINVNGNTISVTDTNGNLILLPNGTGSIIFQNGSAEEILELNDTASAVNGLAITAGATGNPAQITTGTGSEANIDIGFLTNGTGVLSVTAGSGNYEDNVTADDDIPNKKYVDDAVAATGGSGTLDSVTGTVDLTSATAQNIGAATGIPASATILSVTLDVTAASDAATTVTVGDATNGAASYMAATENDPETTGIYIADGRLANGGAARQAQATVATAGTVGSATCIITFRHA